MNDYRDKSFEQAAAFQKMWMESLARMQSAFFMPTMAPPSELLQQMRSGFFKTLEQSWDQFMRSPQFLNGMQQWMKQMVNFRKLSNDFSGKFRDTVPSVSEADIDNCLITLRHTEKRIVDRINELASQLHALSEQVALIQKNGSAKKQVRKRKRAAARTGGNGSVSKVQGKRLKKNSPPR